MTPEAQRIAIAEACGWRHKQVTGITGFVWMWLPPRLTLDKHLVATCPDYPSDLNAMHEAEKEIIHDGDLWNSYETNLRRICHKAGQPVVSATDAQRAEAFLKTLNLWKP